METRILDDSLINALRESGEYIFVFKKIFVSIGFVAESYGNARLNLEKDDILDESIQEGILDFMKEFRVIKICLDGEDVWHESQTDSYSNLGSVYH